MNIETHLLLKKYPIYTKSIRGFFKDIRQKQKIDRFIEKELYDKQKFKLS